MNQFVLTIATSVALSATTPYEKGFEDGWKNAISEFDIVNPEKDVHALKNIKRIQVLILPAVTEHTSSETILMMVPSVREVIEKRLKEKGIEILDSADRDYTTQEASLVVHLSCVDQFLIKGSFRMVQKGYFLRNIDNKPRFFQGVATTWDSIDIAKVNENPKKEICQWMDEKMDEFFTEWDKVNLS